MVSIKTDTELTLLNSNFHYYSGMHFIHKPSISKQTKFDSVVNGFERKHREANVMTLH